MKYDVFISYSSKDQKVVEAMCAYLEQHKVRCFVAYRDIPKGVVWAKAIVDALDESRMMVVVFSEEFNLSVQVDREIELASEGKKPILTFRISDAIFMGAKKYYLKNINWIDAFPHPERMFDTLLGNIFKLIGLDNGTSVRTSADKTIEVSGIRNIFPWKLCFITIAVLVLVIGGLYLFNLRPWVGENSSSSHDNQRKSSIVDGHVSNPSTNKTPSSKADSGSIFVSDSGSSDFVLKIKGVEYPMVFVEGGTFRMGSNDSDPVNYIKPHQVTLNDYSIGKYEVTQELWESVMGSNPTIFFKGSRKPVAMVSWNDCQEFIRKLNDFTGKNFRLPTEAEWEFAARGGKKSQGYMYSGSNVIGEVAWYYDNSGSEAHDVGTKIPNELGIYDMTGNVWEWCSDWYGSYDSSSQINPTGPFSGTVRVLRGGSYHKEGILKNYKMHYRNRNYPEYRNHPVGLRLCL